MTLPNQNWWYHTKQPLSFAIAGIKNVLLSFLTNYYQHLSWVALINITYSHIKKLFLELKTLIWMKTPWTEITRIFADGLDSSEMEW